MIVNFKGCVITINSSNFSVVPIVIVMYVCVYNIYVCCEDLILLQLFGNSYFTMSSSDHLALVQVYNTCLEYVEYVYQLLYIIIFLVLSDFILLLE